MFVNRRTQITHYILIAANPSRQLSILIRKGKVALRHKHRSLCGVGEQSI